MEIGKKRSKETTQKMERTKSLLKKLEDVYSSLKCEGISTEEELEETEDDEELSSFDDSKIMRLIEESEKTSYKLRLKSKKLSVKKEVQDDLNDKTIKKTPILKELAKKSPPNTKKNSFQANLSPKAKIEGDNEEFQDPLKESSTSPSKPRNNSETATMNPINPNPSEPVKDRSRIIAPSGRLIIIPEKNRPHVSDMGPTRQKRQKRTKRASKEKNEGLLLTPGLMNKLAKGKNVEKGGLIGGKTNQIREANENKMTNSRRKSSKPMDPSQKEVGAKMSIVPVGNKFKFRNGKLIRIIPKGDNENKEEKEIVLGSLKKKPQEEKKKKKESVYHPPASPVSDDSSIEEIVVNNQKVKQRGRSDPVLASKSQQKQKKNSNINKSTSDLTGKKRSSLESSSSPNTDNFTSRSVAAYKSDSTSKSSETDYSEEEVQEPNKKKKQLAVEKNQKSPTPNETQEADSSSQPEKESSESQRTAGMDIEKLGKSQSKSAMDEFDKYIFNGSQNFENEKLFMESDEEQSNKPSLKSSKHSVMKEHVSTSACGLNDESEWNIYDMM